jgi:hypothetical protein
MGKAVRKEYVSEIFCGMCYYTESLGRIYWWLVGGKAGRIYWWSMGG